METPFGATQYEFDLMDRIVRVVAHDGTATLYEYDANGNRTAVRHANGLVVTYESTTRSTVLSARKYLTRTAHLW